MESLRRRTCTGCSDSPDSPVEKINVYFKVFKTIAMEVERSQTIEGLKTMLSEKEGISENFQELFFGGERLKDGQKLHDCGVRRNSTLHLYLQNSIGMMDVFVKMASEQKTIMLQVKTYDTIQNIKTMIQSKERIQSDEFSLYSLGKKLNDESTLASLNLKSESILDLVFNPRDVVSVFVKTQTGSIERLEVRLLHTVEVIKAIVGSMLCTPVSDFRLSFAGKSLVGCQTLAYYDVKEGSTLEILPPLISIFVKTWSGKSVILNLERGDTVIDLREKIFQKVGLPVKYQSINYTGKRLDDDRDLASYGIQNESTLNLSVSCSTVGVSCSKYRLY